MYSLSVPKPTISEWWVDFELDYAWWNLKACNGLFQLISIHPPQMRIVFIAGHNFLWFTHGQLPKAMVTPERKLNLIHVRPWTRTLRHRGSHAVFSHICMWSALWVASKVVLPNVKMWLQEALTTYDTRTKCQRLMFSPDLKLYTTQLYYSMGMLLSETTPLLASTLL